MAVLTGVARKLSAGELAREPRSLALVAYYDGWVRGCNPAAQPWAYPRRLTLEEAASWREGFAEGKRDATNCPEHDAHWCSTCPHPWGPYDVAP